MILRGLTWVSLALCTGLAGCVDRVADGYLERGETTGGRYTASDGRVRISVLPYSSEMTIDVLGVDLRSSDQMAVEVAVESLQASHDRTFVFYRHNALATFDDGAQRHPIDPMKVYQKNRVEMTEKAAAYAFFGVLGMAAAEATDDNRRIGLAGASHRELRLTPAESIATGFLFFDTQGIEGRHLTELIVDYEQVGIDELWRLKIDLGGFEYRPQIAPEDRPEAHDRDRGIDW